MSDDILSKLRGLYEDVRARIEATTDFKAMQYEVALAVSAIVQSIAAQLDSPEIHTCIIAQAIVVIAGNENDTGALAGLAQ